MGNITTIPTAENSEIISHRIKVVVAWECREGHANHLTGCDYEEGEDSDFCATCDQCGVRYSVEMPVLNLS